MVSAGVNVLRWSALGVGIFYGFSHQRSITASDKAHEAKAEWDRKQSLITRAKQEYQKQTQPQSFQSQTAGKADLNDPNVDLDTLITYGEGSK
ncbi:hypothetical protein EJ05DRAFT_504254 [Pseudovirgaria hyperparasitica]|uniref:ATP synthase F(0) complex subunit e, mitochondrial n=1 Tax=Pseudovirgaria hyperparasitica TaxID=470096 RepID=A0A6A6VV90_9PEZI|nr:uncharacterized protein EJ05DRAFT_504254 [Pseudovirgaria hyperparasitica]KAF2754143.1 hypothetical protein EJ05DRAFT_504254 [Pseudovirgaria hyperparasitica]